MMCGRAREVGPTAPADCAALTPLSLAGVHGNLPIRSAWLSPYSTKAQLSGARWVGLLDHRERLSGMTMANTPPKKAQVPSQPSMTASVVWVKTRSSAG